MKIIYGKLVKQIDDLKEQMEKDAEIFNNRIDRRRDELTDYVDKSNTELKDINTKLTRILTKMELEDG